MVKLANRMVRAIGRLPSVVNKVCTCQRVKMAKRYPNERVKPPPTMSQSKEVGKKANARVATRTCRVEVKMRRLKRKKAGMVKMLMMAGRTRMMSKTGQPNPSDRNAPT